ncbi:hypothetical protein ABID30_002209 [Enterococcus rotai]|uniref:DUF4145 domain-containing protein n=1 Tax=Enterococcus rotai TaxID=118060 RepID=A0A0U2MZF9_9ENTE|nr:DUF4145 domain-containing protein [Enterococcus rotai]ALS38483.1 hypothetical protein ATZ35_15415 [Enterococcus rotai]
MKRFNEIELPVLVPNELLDDYHDYMNEDLRNVLRATTIRRYLEGIVNLFFKDKLKEEYNLSNAMWGRDKLDKNINAIRDYYDEEIGNKLHKVRVIGNKGTHFGKVEPTMEEIKQAINIITNIFEDMIINYFKKNPFEGLPLHILSYLPPHNRIKILTEIWKATPIGTVADLIIIDKLSMAYLKNLEPERAFNFIIVLYENSTITKEFAIQQLEKLKLLNSNLPQFNISKNVVDTAKVFKDLIEEKELKEYSEFEKIFFILIKGYISNTQEESDEG